MPVDESKVVGRAAMIEAFATAAQEDKKPLVTGRDGRAVLEIAVAAYQSGARHQPAELPL